MLQRDVRQRATAKQILQHDWLRQGGVASAAPIEPEVLARIRKYAAGNRLRKEAMKLIAANLPADEIAGLRWGRGEGGGGWEERQHWVPRCARML